MMQLPSMMEQQATEIAALPAQELQQLQQQVERCSKQLKQCKERLADAITLKYGVRASAVRLSHAKETGVVRFEDEGICVLADIAKKPKWDQEQLCTIAEKIRASGGDPTEFMTVTYKVPESKYTAWPESLREQFTSARTLTFGQQSFLLVDKKEGNV